MVKIYYDKDADLNLLKGKTIAIIGYGIQGSGGKGSGTGGTADPYKAAITDIILQNRASLPVDRKFAGVLVLSPAAQVRT